MNSSLTKAADTNRAYFITNVLISDMKGTIAKMLLRDNMKYLPGGRPEENRPPIENGYDVNVFTVYVSNSPYLVDNHEQWVHDVAPIHVPALRSQHMMKYDNGDYNIFNKVHIPVTDLAKFQEGITSHNKYLNDLSQNDNYNLITILAWPWHGNVLFEHFMKLKGYSSYDPPFTHMHAKRGSSKCTVDENGFPCEIEFYLHTMGPISYAVCEGQLRKITGDNSSTARALIQHISDMEPIKRVDIWMKALQLWRDDMQSIILKAPRLDQDIYLYHGTAHGVNYKVYFQQHMQSFSLCPCVALLYSRQKHKNEIHVIYRMKVPAKSPLLMIPGLFLAVNDYTCCEVLIPQDMSIQEKNRYYIDYDRGLDHNGKAKGLAKCEIIDIILENPRNL